MPFMNHPKRRGAILTLALLATLLAISCSKYDASQAALEEQQMGAPPTLQMTAPDSAAVRDSVRLELRIVPGDYPYSNYSVAVEQGGDILLRRTTRQTPTLVEIEVITRFNTRGDYWIWANVWDTESQLGRDSALIHIR